MKCSSRGSTRPNSLTGYSGDCFVVVWFTDGGNGTAEVYKCHALFHLPEESGPQTIGLTVSDPGALLVGSPQAGAP